MFLFQVVTLEGGVRGLVLMESYWTDETQTTLSLSDMRRWVGGEGFFFSFPVSSLETNLFNTPQCVVQEPFFITGYWVVAETILIALGPLITFKSPILSKGI